MSAGSDVDRKYIRDIQYKLQFDDPINIQFTSVSSLVMWRELNFISNLIISTVYSLIEPPGG